MSGTYPDDRISSTAFMKNEFETQVDHSKDELLEFSLCGDAAELYVRETSVICCPVSEKEDIQKFNEEWIHRNNVEVRENTSSSITQSKSQQSAGGDKIHRVAKTQHAKKRIIKTYFEEEMRKIRTKEYIRELNESMKRRKLWKQFQRELKKDVKIKLIRSSGPEWWQEPSRKQITLATALGDVIKADKEEGVTGRTRQWLLDLGVVTRLTPKQVKTSMRRSLLNPVDFLLEVHDIVVAIQKNTKKKKGVLEKPFSVDERLLLTAVCVLQLPILLTMLHYIMPPPKPLSKSKHVQEILFGDLDDESIRYSTPYMEPLPFRNQKDFRDWAFDRVYRALMPSIIESMSAENDKRNSIARKLSTSPMTSHVFASILPGASSDISDLPQSKPSTSPSVLWLISRYVANKQVSPSIIPVIDQSIDIIETNRKSFSRQLMEKIQFATKSQKRSSVAKAVLHEQTKNAHGADITLPFDAGGPSNTNLIQFGKLEINPNDLVHSNSLRTRTITAMSVEEHVPDIESRNWFKNQNEKLDGNALRHEFDENKIDELSSNKIKNTENISRSSYLNKLGITSFWSEIEALPKEKQLQHAIRVLADKGDPLAQLPRIHRLPTVQRWLELRQGRKRILSEKDKDELLAHSKGMWKSNILGNSKEIPKIKCSKRKERLLTWDKKNWLTDKVTKEEKNYYSRIRTEKVDNARTFFSSMLNHYDHGSKLNRNFRDVFFAYMPSKENDTKVFRPWQPNETRDSRNK